MWRSRDENEVLLGWRVMIYGASYLSDQAEIQIEQFLRNNRSGWRDHDGLEGSYEIKGPLKEMPQMSPENQKILDIVHHLSTSSDRMYSAPSYDSSLLKR